MMMKRSMLLPCRRSFYLGAELRFKSIPWVAVVEDLAEFLRRQSPIQRHRDEAARSAAPTASKYSSSFAQARRTALALQPRAASALANLRTRAANSEKVTRRSSKMTAVFPGK